MCDALILGGIFIDRKAGKTIHLVVSIRLFVRPSVIALTLVCSSIGDCSHASRSKFKFKMSFSYWHGVVNSGTWPCQVQQKVQQSTNQVHC